MKPSLSTLIAVAVVLSAAPLKAASADLAPVPFIIGGDDLIAPAEAATTTPLMVPDSGDIAASTPKAPATPTIPTPVAATPAPVAVAPIAPPVPSATPVATAAPAVVTTTKVEAKAPVAGSEIPEALSFDLADLNKSSLSPSAPIEAPKAPIATTSSSVTLVTTTSVAPVAPKAPVVAPQIVVGDVATAPVASASTPVVTLHDGPRGIPVAPVGDIAPVVTPSVESFAPVVSPTAPSVVVANPIITQAPAAPVASAPVAPIQEWGPSYELNMPAKKLKGVDGSEQIKGMEHVIGRSNPILPAVKGVSPAIAEVGTDFPELHVELIPLDDLLSYLKDYTDKRLAYALAEPLYVTVDLKAKSVEEVLEYIKAHYPVELAYTNDSITVQQRLAKAKREEPLRAKSLDVAPAASTVVMAPVGNVPARLAPSADVVNVAVAMPVAEQDALARNDVEQLRMKARLYDLAKERESLLDERQTINRKIRRYEIDRHDD